MSSNSYSNIVRIRTEKGWSQKNLAQRTGIDPSFLSKIENQKGEPSLEVAQKIAKALETSIEELFPGLSSLNIKADKEKTREKIVARFSRRISTPESEPEPIKKYFEIDKFYEIGLCIPDIIHNPMGDKYGRKGFSICNNFKCPGSIWIAVPEGKIDESILERYSLKKYDGENPLLRHSIRMEDWEVDLIFFRFSRFPVIIYSSSHNRFLPRGQFSGFPIREPIYAEYCDFCGGKLEIINIDKCPNCGEECEVPFRYCAGCGLYLNTNEPIFFSALPEDGNSRGLSYADDAGDSDKEVMINYASLSYYSALSDSIDDDGGDVYFYREELMDSIGRVFISPAFFEDLKEGRLKTLKMLIDDYKMSDESINIEEFNQSAYRQSLQEIEDAERK